MTEEEKANAIEQVLAIKPPAELEFFSKEQLDKLEQERQKMDRSRLFVKTIIDKPDFEEQLQRAEMEGRVYGPSQMSNMNIKFQILDQGLGDRVDLKDSLISRSGQRIIMSGRLQRLIDWPIDGYIIKDESDKLVSALQADGVPAPEIDRVMSALNKFGAVALQAGIFSQLKLNLEDSLGRALPLFSSSPLSDLSSPKPAQPKIPEHGASLEALREKLVKPPGKPAGSPADFKKEMDREVNTPELNQHKEAAQIAAPKPPVPPKPIVPPKPVTPPRMVPRNYQLPDQDPTLPILDNDAVDLDQDAAWRLSSKVVSPKMYGDMPVPQPGAVPKIRNRVPVHGLADLNAVKTVPDLSKIESAHLRQGPLAEQVKTIKHKIGELARQNDMLPVSLLPTFIQSPLFQTYLKAGAMLIQRNMAGRTVVLDNIMAELENQGQDILSQEEFEAVADMKKELESMSGL